MARTVKDYMNAVKQVQTSIPLETEKSVSKNKTAILDFNREDQLFKKGISSNDTPLKAYTFTTKNFKLFKGQPFNRTTLKDTGAFYKAFDLLFKNNILNIFSRDSKSSELQDKYGNDIFGLNKQNEIRTNELIKKDLQTYIKSKLG